MTRIPCHAVAARSARPRSNFSRTKIRKHKVILESVTQERKKLRSVISFETRPPPGYTFITAGNPSFTSGCKELCRKNGSRVYTVSTTPHQRTHNLSQQVHRIGYHFPSTVVATLCMERGLFLSSTGKVVAYQREGRDIHAGKQISSEQSQSTINVEARDAIKDLFSNIPDGDLDQIINTAFRKGKRKVGTAVELPLARRVQLAVVAHIRHAYTDYDRLLKITSFQQARAAVEEPCLEKLVHWRGDDENGATVLEDVFREVIIISDDEDDVRSVEAQRLDDNRAQKHGLESRAFEPAHIMSTNRRIFKTAKTIAGPQISAIDSSSLDALQSHPSRTADQRDHDFGGARRYEAWHRARHRYSNLSNSCWPTPLVDQLGGRRAPIILSPNVSSRTPGSHREESAILSRDFYQPNWQRQIHQTTATTPRHRDRVLQPMETEYLVRQHCTYLNVSPAYEYQQGSCPSRRNPFSINSTFEGHHDFRPYTRQRAIPLDDRVSTLGQLSGYHLVEHVNNRPIYPAPLLTQTMTGIPDRRVSPPFGGRAKQNELFPQVLAHRAGRHDPHSVLHFNTLPARESNRPPPRLSPYLGNRDPRWVIMSESNRNELGCSKNFQYHDMAKRPAALKGVSQVDAHLNYEDDQYCPRQQHRIHTDDNLSTFANVNSVLPPIPDLEGFDTQTSETGVLKYYQIRQDRTQPAIVQTSPRIVAPRCETSQYTPFNITRKDSHFTSPPRLGTVNNHGSLPNVLRSQAPKETFHEMDSKQPTDHRVGVYRPSEVWDAEARSRPVYNFSAIPSPSRLYPSQGPRPTFH
ncbi:hypothetical protein FQN57_003176 [Myotisia sp. PD_48]|nr:hypothetical protein FQN57_003176 [Myotisia sp. PD_48]